MFKRNVISILLFFTFSMVLIHNIIPHHHHQEVADISSHGHHHDKAHHKNHHQDHHKNQNHEPSEFFSHLTILATVSDLSLNLNGDYGLSKTQLIKFVIKFYSFVFQPVKTQLVSISPHPILQYDTQLFTTTQSHRGPPVLVV